MATYRIRIQSNIEEIGPYVSFNMNGKRHDVPMDKEVVVEEAVMELLKNALNPKTITEEIDGQIKSKTVLVPRFSYNVLETIPEAGDVKPLLDEEPAKHKGRFKKKETVDAS